MSDEIKEPNQIFEWLEVKDAVNRINSKHMKLNNTPEHGLDYVKIICNNALPYAIVQVLAMECVLGEKSDDLHIVICAYKQLQRVGYIGIKK